MFTNSRNVDIHEKWPVYKLNLIYLYQFMPGTTKSLCKKCKWYCHWFMNEPNTLQEWINRNFSGLSVRVELLYSACRKGPRSCDKEVYLKLRSSKNALLLRLVIIIKSVFIGLRRNFKKALSFTFQNIHLYAASEGSAGWFICKFCQSVNPKYLYLQMFPFKIYGN